MPGPARSLPLRGSGNRVIRLKERNLVMLIQGSQLLRNPLRLLSKEKDDIIAPC